MQTSKQALDEIIRVNHAGEYGAKRIYEGQMAFIKDKEAKKLIQHMAEQEQEHLDYFDDEIRRRHTRPTALHPIWHLGGYALGAVTALMGKEAAMACTVAVESVIDEHYAEQEAHLAAHATAENQELSQKIAQFRADEQEHHATGLEEGAEDALAYPALTAGIRGITKLAIALSKRV